MIDTETDSVQDSNGDVREFSQHRLLLEVDSELDSNDIENMKFLCQDVIPLSKLQKIDRGIDLFVQLEHANKISPKKGNLEMLVEILFRVRRLDLVKKLGRNSKEVRRKYGGSDRAECTNLLPFRNLLYELLEELTQEEYVTARFVLQSEFGKGTMSKIKSMMEFFTFLEREQELEIDDVGILYRIMDIVKRSDLKQKIQQYERHPNKRGHLGITSPPLAPVAGLGLKPERRHIIINPTTNAVQVSDNDVEMMDTTQNVAPPAAPGSGLLDSHITSISIELAKEPRWRALCSELGIDINDLDELTAAAESAAGKVKLMLMHWREVKVQNSSDAGRLLYLAMYKSNFQVLALQLGLRNLFPGVEMEHIPNSTAENTETAMEVPGNIPTLAPGNLPTQAPSASGNLPTQAPPAPRNDPSHEVAIAAVPPRPQLLNADRQEQENIAIHSEEAQISIVNPPDTNQPAQQNVQTAEGRMQGGSEVPRPTVNETEQQRQERELMQQMQRAHMDNELDLPSYKMDARPRGVCVIINNEQFYKIPGDPNSKEMPNRMGTNRDAERLTYIFQKLDFRVQIHNNQTDVEIVQVLSRIGYDNHNDYDCFVCCILTHGASGHVYGSNGKMIRISVLTSFLRAQKCPTLAGKPKLFFIQACQGREKQEGYDIEADAATIPFHLPKQPDLATDITGREMIPDEADYILGYATVPGYVSYRSRSQGSWFINKLVDMLDKYAYRHDLLSVLVKVNEEVGNAIANVDGGRYKQIPAPLVTLRKKLYFR